MQNCANSAETLYHCTICEDFVACVAGYKNDSHPHKMEKFRFNLNGGGGEHEQCSSSNQQEASA